MKSIILTQLLLFSLIHVQDVRFTIPTKQQEIFADYENKNFSQTLFIDKDEITAEIQSSNPLFMELNFRIFPDNAALNNIEPGLRKLIVGLAGDQRHLKDYLQAISQYLRENIEYSTKTLPQDPFSVYINKQANCIGFSNLVSLMLESNGIKTHFIKGFYLKRIKENIFAPIPHRWLEIQLADKNKYFYDPQYQNFSANYIKVKDHVDFKRIKKFNVYLVKESKKIIN